MTFISQSAGKNLEKDKELPESIVLCRVMRMKARETARMSEQERTDATEQQFLSPQNLIPFKGLIFNIMRK